jgi:uncharacterized protein involved in exopolysaccharide biosynthesis
LSMEDPHDSPEQGENGRLGLRRGLVVLRRRLWTLLACTFLVPASALAVSLVQGRQYTPATSLGVLLGVILGVGLAFLRQRFDRRVRDAKELEATFRRPVRRGTASGPRAALTAKSLSRHGDTRSRT